MVGPTLTIKRPGGWINLALLDAVIVLSATGGAYGSLLDRSSSIMVQALAGASVAVVFFMVALGVERGRLRLAGQRRPPGGLVLAILGAIGVTTEEACDPTARVKGGLAGFGIDGALGSISGVIAWWLHGSGGSLRVWVTVLTAAVASCCLVRLLPILGVDGGRILSGVAELADDDESASRAAQLCSLLMAMILALGGVGLMLKANEHTFWGVGMTVAAIQAASLSTWYESRVAWLAGAAVTPLSQLPPPAFPTVGAQAPVGELMSVFAVEGPRALIVIVDQLGTPVGVVQGQEFGRFWRGADELSTVCQAMTPIADLQRVPVEDMTIAGAVAWLERERVTIAAFEDRRGRPRVVTFQELNHRGR